MATSIRDFNIGLYLEHLEEASFLYEQRLAYLQDPEVNWPDLEAWEARLEAHFDALVVGRDLALEICRQQATAGDAGAMHAALRVFCRQDRKDDVFAALGAFDPADERAVQAAALALCSEAGWRDDFLRAFRDDQSHLTQTFARVIGYRRFASEELLTRKLSKNPALGRAELAWALGRVGSIGSVPLLRSLLDDDDQRVCEAAAVALMRLGDDLPIQRAMLAAGTHAWARRVLAIGGNSKSVRVLLDALRGQNPDANVVIALGLLGDLTAVAPLVELLNDDALAEAAAVALNTITGAQLYARVFVPDQADPDELTDDERETFEKDGTLPTRNGKPYGNWERRPLLDKAGWRAWLEDNKHRFSKQQRWRMGKPHGPTALFECLKAETSPYVVRAGTYEELVVRFGLDVPFEVDLPVSQQRRFLGKIEGWISGQSANFEDGRWYFAGQLQG